MQIYLYENVAGNEYRVIRPYIVLLTYRGRCDHKWPPAPDSGQVRFG